MPRTIWNHFHYTMILLHTSKCWLWSLEVWQFWQRCHLHEMEFSHEGRSFVRLRRKLQLLRSNTSTRNAPRRCNPLRFQIYFFLFLLLISFHCWCYHFKIWNIPSLVFVLFLILVLVPWSLSFIILLPSSLSPSLYLPLSPSATSWNQMQQSQKNLKYIAIMQKCIHKSFDGGFWL